MELVTGSWALKAHPQGHSQGSLKAHSQGQVVSQSSTVHSHQKAKVGQIAKKKINAGHERKTPNHTVYHSTKATDPTSKHLRYKSNQAP